jgi:hypothetical protein
MFFKGDQVWALDGRTNRLMRGYPQNVTQTGQCSSTRYHSAPIAQV